jgi:hypothetical protein
MLTVTCKSCGTSGMTADAAHPGMAVLCSCCPLPHDHDAAAIATGTPCRPVSITWHRPLALGSA